VPIPSTITVSIASLTNLLAQRLGCNLAQQDYWNSAELDLYIRMTMREFQVLTGYWRDRVTLTTAANTPWYDLNALGIVPFTVQDTGILQQVGYQLLEYSGTQASVINSNQFTLAAVTAAFDQRQEEILGETRLVVTDYPAYSGGPPADGRIPLSSGVIQIHRADWRDTSIGQWGLVSRSDEMGASGWAYGWNLNPAVPRGYTTALTRPFVFQLIPPPIDDGQLDLLVTSCEPYVYTGAPQGIQIPDDASFALPMGILADMFSQDAQGRDYRRADYCLRRFRSALEVLKDFPLIMQAWPGGVQQEPVALFQLDHWQDGWRNATGSPATVANGGRNLLACSPVPSAPGSITLDVVTNSPASLADRTQNFDLAGDVVSGILSGAQHLSCLKMGGAEFEGTFPLYADFLSVAEKNADRLRAQSINWEALRAVAKIENADKPYEMAAVEA
jgi:hypothetical protein